MEHRDVLEGDRPAASERSLRNGPGSAFPPVRAHDLLVTLLGRHVFGLDEAVYSGTFIELLGSAGITEPGTRSVLSRATARGLLARHRKGRRTYFLITPRLRAALAEGEPRIYELAPVLHGWRGDWSLLSFSLPESRRSERHRLRIRLGWAGFGVLRDGLWIAPGRVAFEEVLGDLAIDEYVTAFNSRVMPDDKAKVVVQQAWDLPGIAASFNGFLQRWSAPDSLSSTADEFVRELYLVTDWRLLLREAPALPAELLPPGWPAETAARLFRRTHRQLRRDADRRFEEALVLMNKD